MLNKKLITGIIIAIIVLAYAASPIDILPDIIPIIGWIDDVLVIILGVIAWWRL